MGTRGGLVAKIVDFVGAPRNLVKFVLRSDLAHDKKGVSLVSNDMLFDTF